MLCHIDPAYCRCPACCLLFFPFNCLLLFPCLAVCCYPAMPAVVPLSCRWCCYPAMPLVVFTMPCRLSLCHAACCCRHPAAPLLSFTLPCCFLSFTLPFFPLLCYCMCIHVTVLNDWCFNLPNMFSLCSPLPLSPQATPVSCQAATVNKNLFLKKLSQP